MPVELVYTSVRKGLHPGSSDYCTVRETEGLSRALRRKLESLSSYEWLTASSASAVQLNPPRLLHLIDQKAHIVSSVVPARPDHTGRSNHVAHHVVFPANETAPVAPITLLRSKSLFKRTWGSGDQCRFTSEIPGLPAALNVRETAAADAEVSRLAEYLGRSRSTPLYVFYSQQTDAAGFLARLSAATDDPWSLTFATYFDPQQLSAKGCQVRCVVVESRYGRTEAQKLRSNQNCLFLSPGGIWEPNQRLSERLESLPDLRPTPGESASSSGSASSRGQLERALQESTAGRKRASQTSQASTSPKSSSASARSSTSLQAASAVPRRQIAKAPWQTRLPSRKAVLITFGVLGAAAAASLPFLMSPEETPAVVSKAKPTDYADVLAAAELGKLEAALTPLRKAVGETRATTEELRAWLADRSITAEASAADLRIERFEAERCYQQEPVPNPFSRCRERVRALSDEHRQLVDRAALYVALADMRAVLDGTGESSELVEPDRLKRAQADPVLSTDLEEYDRLATLLSWFESREAVTLKEAVRFLNTYCRNVGLVEWEVSAAVVATPFLSVESRPGHLTLGTQADSRSLTIAPTASRNELKITSPPRRLKCLAPHIRVAIRLGSRARPAIVTSGSTSALWSERLDARGWSFPKGIPDEKLKLSLRAAAPKLAWRSRGTVTATGFPARLICDETDPRKAQLTPQDPSAFFNEHFGRDPANPDPEMAADFSAVEAVATLRLTDDRIDVRTSDAPLLHWHDAILAPARVKSWCEDISPSGADPEHPLWAALLAKISADPELGGTGADHQDLIRLALAGAFSPLTFEQIDSQSKGLQGLIREVGDADLALRLLQGQLPMTDIEPGQDFEMLADAWKALFSTQLAKWRETAERSETALPGAAPQLADRVQRIAAEWLLGIQGQKTGRLTGAVRNRFLKTHLPHAHRQTIAVRQRWRQAIRDMHIRSVQVVASDTGWAAWSAAQQWQPIPGTANETVDVLVFESAE